MKLSRDLTRIHDNLAAVYSRNGKICLGIAAFFAVILLLALAWPRIVRAEDALPAPWSGRPFTCEDVRRLVAERGKAQAIVWALEQGLSWRQIYRIRRECGV